MCIEMRPVVGWPGYYVGDDGCVYSRYRRGSSVPSEALTKLSGPPDAGGYPRVHLSINGVHRTFKICVLVATAFHGPKPEGTECSHLNGDPADSTPQNLVWETSRENNARKHAHGTLNTGKRNGNFKHDAAVVKKIKELIAAGLTQERAGKETGTNQSYVWAVLHGKIRKDV